MAQSFSLDIGAWVAKAGDRADLVVRKVSLDMFTKVILKSPVDTGRFRGNWQTGIGSAPGGILETLDKSGSAAISKMSGVIQGARAGDSIYLSNNLSYAVKLEYGHSKQAPQGMVRTTVEEFQAAVNQSVREVQSEIP